MTKNLYSLYFNNHAMLKLRILIFPHQTCAPSSTVMSDSQGGRTHIKNHILSCNLMIVPQNLRRVEIWPTLTGKLRHYGANRCMQYFSSV